MTSYLVYEPDRDEEEDALPIVAESPSDAAEAACEHWRRHGRWTGGAPSTLALDLIVTDVATGVKTPISVEVRMEVAFYAQAPR